VEEKYGKKAAETKGAKDPEPDDDSDGSSSTSTDEDEDGILASDALDDQFNATLQAIRNKDPRVYDAAATFYTDADENHPSDVPRKEKPMFLQDYHRENLLRGNLDAEVVDPEPTYVQQQGQLKKAVLKEMHDATAEADSETDDEDFLVAKEKPVEQDSGRARTGTITAAEVENASVDPDAFLSKFMSSRAWVHAEGFGQHPFESDDEEEEERADAIEEAYNLRFEDPSKANDKLISHARDAVEKFSVRKDALSKRQRAREAEKEGKQAEKEERKLDKARLRKLRIEEAQSKLARIKDAAGATSGELKLDEWKDLLAGDWDEDQWEAEMQKKFDDAYYEEQSGSENGEDTAKQRKPKWEDDIDINDLVPDFDAGDDAKFSLSSDESEAQAEAAPPKPEKRQKKDRLAAKAERRTERRQLEQLVDAQLDLDSALNGTGSVPKGPAFRYRETSPTAFGMSSKDILFAEDTQLNKYAGLKKLAAFRDTEKKRQDKKRLGKKARLREWRKETFGHERGPRQSLQDVIREQLAARANGGADEEMRMPPGKKRKRSKASEAS
jgi:protein KRI1